MMPITITADSISGLYRVLEHTPPEISVRLIGYGNYPGGPLQFRVEIKIPTPLEYRMQPMPEVNHSLINVDRIVEDPQMVASLIKEALIENVRMCNEVEVKRRGYKT